jgi:hypothetical protein
VSSGFVLNETTAGVESPHNSWRMTGTRNERPPDLSSYRPSETLAGQIGMNCEKC